MKPILFCDFDGVICNTVQAVADLYNKSYCHSENFVPAVANKCTKWDMSDICPLIKDINSVFNELSLFHYLKPFPHAVEVLKELSEKYQIIIITIGDNKNLQYKLDWIYIYLPFIEDIILIKNKGCIMDKSIINMASKDSETVNIFVDDNQDNLFSVQGQNNLIRYCFAQNRTEWNSKWIDMNGRILKNWLEVRQELLKPSTFDGYSK
jgi:5'(3')-deoxyribonucleotidase